MQTVSFLLLLAVAGKELPDYEKRYPRMKTTIGKSLQDEIESENKEMDRTLLHATAQVNHLKQEVDHRDQEASEPSAFLQTNETEGKPTSLMEADARVAASMKELDKVLSFDELDDKPSSLIELPGLAQQKERFEAARQKLKAVEQSISEDSKKMQDRARRAAAAMLEEPSSLIQTQSKQQATMQALSHASQGVQQWAASIAQRQNSFIQKMANHGIKIPPRLREAMARDRAFSLVQTKPSIMDSIPVTNISPRMVDDQMKAVEHRLRHDAQIFQEEANSGRRPILPASFMQTTDPDDDRDDEELDKAGEKENPVRHSFNEMQRFRKAMQADKKMFEEQDATFREGAKRAKADLREWGKEHAEDALSGPVGSSFLQTDEAPVDIKKVDDDWAAFASKVHGETARWKSAARHAKTTEGMEEAAYDAAVKKFKKQRKDLGHGLIPRGESFLQTEAQSAAMQEDSEMGTAALADWQQRMEANARERDASRRALDRDLSFKAADFGPELLQKYENTGGATSLLQTADEDPGLQAKLAAIEERAKDDAAAMNGDAMDADTVTGTEPFKGVITPGVVSQEAVPEDASSAGEAAAKADADAVKAEDAAEKAEEKAVEEADPVESLPKEDDQLRKH